ncbi:phage/plasmid primase, P4 family [Micromonospora sp. WMMD1082]|uniref:phage/plasmid primase, P4 family n=1 Tax=Micromonospora sp. WMMD1082 TaxID=3016104 RepID=UPI0024178D15|nr:phage/plasmid primase, P4 family [Micromonospora sp. WMMD1082]MDG4792725.1 phage/plasmid primase, P4 family [Micromonospora sp. WMMD1082]
MTDFLDRLGAADDADGWLAVCPAHADSRPSLRIAVGESGAVLLKCRAGCSTVDGEPGRLRPGAVLLALGMSVAELHNIDTTDAPTRARSTSTPASPAAVAALAAQLDGWVNDSHTPGGDEAYRYAADRFGISSTDWDRLGLGYAVDLGGGPRLVVPFRDRDGVPRGYQARALDPRAKVRWLGAKSPQGESWARVGYLPGEAGWAELVVTEGPGDGLTACATGYDVAFVRGAGLAASVADEVAQLADGRPVVVCGDADPSGDKFARTLCAELAKRGLSARSVRPPVDGDDLTDWRGRHPEGFSTEFIRAVVSAEDPGALKARLDAWTDADLTEVASARRLKDHFEAAGSGVRYSPEAGFFILRGGVWRADKLDEVRTAAQDVAASIWAEAFELAEALKEVARDGDKAEAKELGARVGKLKAFAKAANSSKGIDAMVRELRALRGVAADLDQFDRHHHLLATRNGVIDLRTGELRPHDPELLLTRMVDLDYDPEATAPRWEAFLREVFPYERHAGLPAYMRRLVGYGITGETGEQCFVVLWGKGANGKSVYTDTLTEVFRELTVTTPFATFEEKPSGGIPNDLAALKGARFVFAAEGEQGRPMAEAVLKRVTGRDSISARFMRKEFFEFRPTFLLQLATNFKPQFRGQDEGLWRRVKLVPWERYFAPAERDHKLGAKLLAEAPGILAWAVRGAVEWYRDGLGDPAAIKDATREYRATSDALAGLIPGVFTLEEGGKVQARIAWDAYRQWCEDEALPAKERWTRRAFFAALEERGAVKKRANTGVVFDGIRLARPTDQAAEENPGEARTVASPLAHRQGDSTPTAGPSLDDVFA